VRDSFSAVLTVFRVFLRLGCTSFGGPAAHLGYFREEFVNRRKWVDEKQFIDLVALCQFLPGPASSQVAMAVGDLRAGPAGGLAAWLGFTTPSALGLILLGYGAPVISRGVGIGWIHGLKVVAVAVVALAVWSMASTVCVDLPRKTAALLAAMAACLWPTALCQILVILAAGITGWALSPSPDRKSSTIPVSPVAGRHRAAYAALGVFFILLAASFILGPLFPHSIISIASGFYRSGSLVFGGGHVVLPLLQKVVEPQGWVSNDAFLTGYGAAQAAPGPLFSFAAYLGTVMKAQPHGWLGGAICLVAIYLPSFLLVPAVLPFWGSLRERGTARSALALVNAAVVGLLLAALYSPVWTSAVLSTKDFALALACFAALAFRKVQPWIVVLAVAVLSFLVY
jgi:chromate transporter